MQNFPIVVLVTTKNDAKAMQNPLGKPIRTL